MNDSILETIKKMLGIEPDYEPFDVEIVALINTMLMALAEIGVVKDGFMITGPFETWFDAVGERDDLEAIKTYIHLRVKLVFDPPATQTTSESYKNVISEMEWRLYSKTGF